MVLIGIARTAALRRAVRCIALGPFAVAPGRFPHLDMKRRTTARGTAADVMAFPARPPPPIFLKSVTALLYRHARAHKTQWVCNHTRSRTSACRHQHRARNLQ